LLIVEHETRLNIAVTREPGELIAVDQTLDTRHCLANDERLLLPVMLHEEVCTEVAEYRHE
jgi:hypothetical protein